MLRIAAPLSLVFVIGLMPSASHASCTSYPDWESAQVALENGAERLDGGIGPREPDGIACEGNAGFPGKRAAKRFSEMYREQMARRENDAGPDAPSRAKDDVEDVGRRFGVDMDASCSDFETPRHAQIAFIENPRKLAVLDPDGDFVVCQGADDFAGRPSGDSAASDERGEDAPRMRAIDFDTWTDDGVGVAPQSRLDSGRWPRGSRCAGRRFSVSGSEC